jgi:hypothetical protein
VVTQAGQPVGVGLFLQRAVEARVLEGERGLLADAARQLDLVGAEVTLLACLDQAHQAVPGVRVQLKVGENVVASAQTDQKGRAEFTDVGGGRYIFRNLFIRASGARNL